MSLRSILSYQGWDTIVALLNAAAAGDLSALKRHKVSKLMSLGSILSYQGWDTIVALLYAAAAGDLSTLKRHKVSKKCL
jgi:hypothetical protein